MSESGKKKTSIIVDEKLWVDWSVYVLRKYGNTRKMSEALEAAMKFYMEKKPIPA